MARKSRKNASQVQDPIFDMVADPAGNTAFQAWCQSALTTAPPNDESILDRLKRTTQLNPPASPRINRGVPPSGGFNESEKMRPAWCLWPIMTHKLGRLVSPEDRTKSGPKVQGPKTSDGRGEIILNFRLGAGVSEAERKRLTLLALAHEVLMLAIGEPEADARNAVRPYGGRYWTLATAFGFSDAERTDKYRPTEGLDRYIKSLAAVLPDIPVGVVELEPGMTQQTTRNLKVQCPYDLRDDAEAIPGNQLSEAIADGRIHFRANMSGSYNKAKALPFCGRDKHPKVVTINGTEYNLGKHVRCVMVVADGEEGIRILEPGEDPNPPQAIVTVDDQEAKPKRSRSRKGTATAETPAEPPVTATGTGEAVNS